MIAPWYIGKERFGMSGDSAAWRTLREDALSTLGEARRGHRHRPLGVVLAVLGVILTLALPRSDRAAQFPQLLPDAHNFALSLQEDPTSTLPLGPACGGEAALTLACRAFILTLKNVGAHTVHLSGVTCREPYVILEMRPPNSSSGWWPISQPSYSTPCKPLRFENRRLRPGEATEYRTRLVSPVRPAEPGEPVGPGTYSVRARWALIGCTEDPEGTDCLARLQVLRPASSVADVELQTPVEVVSNAIEVASPALPDLGRLKIGFDVSLAPEAQAAVERRRAGGPCASHSDASVACTVFHFAIRNLSDRAIRNGRMTCSDYSIMPEYRTGGSDWKRLRSSGIFCFSNILIETPIAPGKAAEGDFTIGELAPRFDTTPLYPAATYELRFRFQPAACWASPDGSFCIQRPKEQPLTLSNVIAINATAFPRDSQFRFQPGANPAAQDPGETLTRKARLVTIDAASSKRPYPPGPEVRPSTVSSVRYGPGRALQLPAIRQRGPLISPQCCSAWFAAATSACRRVTPSPACWM